MLNRLFKSEHQRVADVLSAYIDGELSPKEQARVEKHLAQCAACAQDLHTLRQTAALLEQLPPVAVPRSFAIRPAPAAQRVGLFQARRTYVFLRSATVVATILLAVVLAGDAFFTGLAPYLAPAREMAVPAAEVVPEVEVEKAVVETVVEREMVVAEALPEASIVEGEPAYAATPSPAPAVAAREMEAADTPPAVEKEALAEAPLRPTEEQIAATAIPTPSPADAIATPEPAFTPTAVVKAPPQEPTIPAAARPSRLGLVLLRVAEAGLLSLVLVLAIATLVAKRRQGAG